jgi:D-serine deaminase-like pyridoxal phosphate-dependent protein
MPRSAIGTPKANLDTPALCLDIVAAEANIQRMADFLRDGPVGLRPHSKTHKSPILAQKQLAAGAIGITCAKLSEAEVMASAGIRDILIANQIVGAGKIARLVDLAGATQVIVAVDDAANVADLDAAARARGVRLRTVVEVDIGMGRCGVAPGPPAMELARRIVNSDGLRFEGLLGYEGHTVMLPDPQQRRALTEASLKLLVDTAALLRNAGIAAPIVSSGGTGTYFITGRYPGITEIEPGSYVTMDSQYRDTVGIDFACALTVLATVISAPGPDRAEIDAGLKTLTRDFGLPAVLAPAGWELVGLAEEHGHLRRRGGPALQPGDKVEIVPNHGCTTINLHDEYHVIRGGILEAVWPIAARGKIS